MLAFALLPTLLGLLIAAGWSAVVRYRRADAVQRAQLRWLALAAARAGHPAAVLDELRAARRRRPGARRPRADLLALPAAVAVAMLRHDLYDIDRLLSATATYALVTGLLLAVWTTVVAGADCCSVATRPPWPSPSRRSPPSRSPRCAPACSGGWTAGSTRPAGRRWRPSTPAHPHRRRAGAPRGAAGACGDALRDPELRVGYRRPGQRRPGRRGRGAVGPDATTARAGVRGGAEIGMLCGGSGAAGAAARKRRRPPRCWSSWSAARRAHRGAARGRAAGRGCCRRATQERRRLERDLHDGAQQRLVSLGHGPAARAAASRGGRRERACSTRPSPSSSTAVAELRQIATGCGRAASTTGSSPPSAACTTGRCRSSWTGPEPLPDDVATTAYYVASEAMANAIKHADADTIAVRVARDGGPAARPRQRRRQRRGAAPSGSGLAGLVDRVGPRRAAARCEPPGRGTLVEAVLPCAS